MSATPPQRTLDDFVEFLAFLTDAGVPFSIIGGCAVGFYARRLKQSVFSNDVDLCTSVESLQKIIRLARANESTLTIEKLPQPRGVPAAVLYWKSDLEINVLTASDGLPPIETLLERSSQYEMPAHTGLSLKIADPCDLLINKRRINREKDAPHIPILEEFIHVRAIAEFKITTNSTRVRIEFVREYMSIAGQALLTEPDAIELVPHANEPSLRKFLMSIVPTEALASQIVQLGDQSESVSLWAIYRTTHPKPG